MKIIMHEGERKSGIRGKNRVNGGNCRFYGGEHSIDRNFINGHEDLLQFGLDLWEKHEINK